MANSAGVEVARISVKVSPDTRKFRSELKRDLEQIERSVRGTVQLDAELDRAGAVSQMKRLMASLRVEGARGVDVDVDVNRGLGGRLQGLSQRLESVGDNAGYAGRQFLGLTRTGWIVAAVAAAAAPAVGLVSGLLAGIPSLVSAFGAGAGAVALGLDGIKAAALPLAPALDSLKASVSGVFEQRLTPVFDQLRSLLPTLESGMQGVAHGLADMFQGVTDAVTSGAGVAQLQSILGNVGAMFTQLKPTIQTATQSFLTLSDAGSRAFGHLTAPLQTFASQFDAMVGRITSSGAFDGAMQGLSQTLGSVLGLFNRLMESGVQAMGQLGGPLSTLINGLGDAFIAAMPALTSFSAFIGNVGGTLLSSLAPALKAITPGLTALSNTFGAILTQNLQSLSPVLTEVAGALSTTLTTALQQLQPLLPSLLSTFQQFATVLSGQLAQHLPTLAQSFGQILGAVIPLTPKILQLGTQLATVLIPAMAKVAPVVVGAVTALASLASAVSGAAQSFLAALGSIRSFASQALGAVVTFVAQAIAKLQELPAQIKALFADAGTWLLDAGKNIVQGLINGIGSMIGSAVAKAKELASSVAGAVTGFLGIKSPSKLFEEFGVNTAEGFGRGLENGFGPVLDQARDIASKVADAFASGTDPTGLLSGLSKTELDRMDKVLRLQTKQLGLQARALDYQAAMSSDGALKDSLRARIKEIRLQEDQLGLQRGMLDLTQDYSDGVDGNGGDSLINAVSGLMNAPVDFAKATGKQFMSDLGISGDGLISRAVSEGIQYVFQIGSVDEALSIKDREDRKSAMSFTGPGR